MADEPLSGLKVIELARILAGPWAGQVLADLGARVTKIESPQGDDTRQWGPPFVKRGDGSHDAAYFHATNRGKQALVADFKTKEGQQLVVDLAKSADVLIENFKVGGLKKYGLDYAALATLNPRLIYCSITGFGQDGPYADRPGYDFIAQGMSGIMDVTGAPDADPQKIGVAYADIMTGLYAVIAIQAALAQRERTGRGQHIDMALLDVMIGTLANQGMNFLVSNISPTRLGNAHPNIAPYEVFPTSDGPIIIAVENDQQFAKLCKTLDLEAVDRFSTNAERIGAGPELSNLISGKTANFSRASLLKALHAVGVPAGPVNSVREALEDPQVMHRQMVHTLELDNGHTVPTIRTPIRFSDISLSRGTAAPALRDTVAFSD